MKNKPVIVSYEYDGLKIWLKTDEHTLDEALDAMEAALKASGYNVPGPLTVEKPEN